MKEALVIVAVQTAQDKMELPWIINPVVVILYYMNHLFSYILKKKQTL